MLNSISQELHDWVQKVNSTFEDLRRDGFSVHGVKPFYTNIRAFDANRSQIMVLGINPGGDFNGDQKERSLGYTERILDPSGNHFCSITTGPNGEQVAENQRYASRMREYISSLLGWENPSSDDRRFALLPLGNMVPFRSPNANIIEDFAWNIGVDFGLKLIDISQPKLLLLIGTGANRSCWGSIDNLLVQKKCQLYKNISNEPETPYAKSMSICWNDTKTVTDILAIPHPNFQITNSLFAQQLRSFRTGYSQWKSTQLIDPYQIQLKTKLSKPPRA